MGCVELRNQVFNGHGLLRSFSCSFALSNVVKNLGALLDQDLIFNADIQNVATIFSTC